MGHAFAGSYTNDVHGRGRGNPLYAITERQPQNKGVHFFLDDYQFERVWTYPEKYGEILKRFKFVLTPDFSLYRNYPKIMQMFNHYRKQWCGCFFQSLGIDVIATACWSDEDSFEWCFDGMPQGTAVALSSVGTQMNKRAKRLFLAGYEKMKEKLHRKAHTTTPLMPGAIRAHTAGNIACGVKRPAPAILFNTRANL